MQIVIDKDKEINELKELLNNLTDKTDIQSVDFAINLLENIGTMLPKGHGRLIDADMLYNEYVKEPEEFNGGHSLMALFRAAPTLVEAESEDEDADSD